MDQEDWTARLGTSIAGEVRRYRLAAGLSAQQLSDTCAKLGAPIPRTVISNIENGRRTNVSVAEVIVLAKALEVPPVALIYPAGFAEEIEYLPGRRVHPLRAIDWFSGEIAIDEKSKGLDVSPSGDLALTIVRHHRFLERRISALYRAIWDEKIAPEEDGIEEEVVRRTALRLSRQLKRLRIEMQRRGLTPPKTYLDLDDLPLVDPTDEQPSPAKGGYWPEEPPF